MIDRLPPCSSLPGWLFNCCFNISHPSIDSLNTSPVVKSRLTSEPLRPSNIFMCGLKPSFSVRAQFSQRSKSKIFCPSQFLLPFSFRFNSTFFPPFIRPQKVVFPPHSVSSTAISFDLVFLTPTTISAPSLG